ncbi:F-box associated region protein [candidate division SR1 bacterium RAAC1_SR1_1]|nr:F-box associated region protein [candidate division SR1 bacterium RAAC1_SR1_1]
MKQKMTFKNLEKNIFVVGILFFGIIGVIFAINTQNEGWRITKSGSSATVNVHNECRVVTNNRTDNDIFVPTSSSAEWLSFRNNLPTNVILAECATCGSANGGSFSHLLPTASTLCPSGVTATNFQYHEGMMAKATIFGAVYADYIDGYRDWNCGISYCFASHTVAGDPPTSYTCSESDSACSLYFSDTCYNTNTIGATICGVGNHKATCTSAGWDDGGWCSATCFVENTPVLIMDGSHKNIQDVIIGDILLGKDNTPNKVIDYYRPILGARKLYSINNGLYFVTPEHPFMTLGGWKSINPEATQREMPNFEILPLKVGDILVKENGESEYIRTMSSISVDPETQLYNFKLDGNNTYYANGYLVHNKSQCLTNSDCSSVGVGSCCNNGTCTILVNGVRPTCN